ncbi:glycosyltransferase family 2 protein [Agrococcus sp. ProA11]|uniref:glycosyltransferase family 2 protein n=1 Tax=Agrococcus chionoecetis TaxID=3153752 RepID=UPI0032613435
MTGEVAAPLPAFAVVIVNFGSSTLLREHAASIELPAGGRIIVVDCFSGSREQARVRELAEEHGWTAVLLEENLGFGGGTNAGVARADELGARVVVALNPDARIDAASLRALVTAVQRDPMLLASPTIVGPGGEPWFAGADLYLADGAVRGARARPRFPGADRREWATGACFAISLELWHATGGFDEEYFLYWEDVDLSHRVLDRGGRWALVDATVVHDAGGTQEVVPGRAKSDIYYYYNIRNRLLYAAKHLDEEHVRGWLRTAPRVGLDVLLRGGRRQLVVSIRPWRAYLRALRDGRRLVREHRTARQPHTTRGAVR